MFAITTVPLKLGLIVVTCLIIYNVVVSLFNVNGLEMNRQTIFVKGEKTFSHSQLVRVHANIFLIHF